jgi:orotate phosphoribosyltransferase
MAITSDQIARTLLRAGAVLLRPAEPFTFASGIRSPVYCDNRLLLGDLAARRMVSQAFAEQCEGGEVLAGPATGGIAWAAWASEILGLPMAYVRSSAKGHGRGQQIEGAAVAGRRVLLLEDTISTGESALNAAQALREAGAAVERCFCIFTWGWPAIWQAFEAADLPLTPLATLDDLLRVATSEGLLADDQRATVERWARDPQSWSPG